jgi:hypothetical protein
MLYEKDVIDAVCDYLQQAGYTITQRLGPKQHGDDIIANGGPKNQEVYVEAKGETSSNPESKRYGKQFDPAQCRDHVAAALYKAATALQKTPPSVKRRVGIALPDTPCHRRLIEQIEQILNRLEIAVIWVDPGKKIVLSGPL